MPHTDDFLLSAEECREIDAAVEAKQARDAAERAFGGLKNAVGAGNAFGHAESPEAQAARKAAETRQADLLMLDAMRQFPSYACETRHLQLADMAPLGWMHSFADAVRFVGAAMPEWGRGLVAKAFGQESVEVVEVPSRQRLLDGLLVIDVTWERTPSQLEQLAARVIDAGERPLIFFGFAERVAGFLETHQQLSLASYEHGKTSNALTAPGLTDLPEQRGIVSYVRSAIGASANLPQFRVNIIDSIVHSPTFTLLLPEEITPEAVVEARRKARIEMLRQPAGRNLRLDAEKVTHPDGREEWVVKPGPQRRVIIFHNPERTPQPECKPLPPPPEVLAGIRERTKPGGFRFLTVRHSAPYIATAIDEFLATREVLTREPVKERKAQSKAQRRRESAEDRQRREAEKKSERRNAVLERLEEERSKGAKWTEAKRSKGVNSPIQTWFTAQERTTLKKLYNDGAALEL